MLTEREILAAINAKASNAYGSESTLENERAQALDYYLGRPFGNEVEGRSQVVTRDVLETVEWILPSLMEIFLGGDKVVEFEPVGPEDEEGAQQESDVLNHVVLQQNDAFTVFYTWFKDAMLSKTAYTKVYYDTKEDIETETYENLSEGEVAFLASDPSVKIEEHWVGELGFGVKLSRTNKIGKVCIDPCPPEEMRVSSNTRSMILRNVDYIEHRTQKPISDIRQMGIKIDDNISGDVSEQTTLEDARDIYDEDQFDDEPADPSMRLVWFRDVTIRIDANGDGIAELKRYYIVGTTILADYDCESVDYAALGPIPMPHRHVGLSVADLVMDLQKLRSTLMRQYVDNLFLQNNGRNAVSNLVNLDDMLVSRPGGVVRVDAPTVDGHIVPLVHPSNGQAAIQGLEYLDTHKENRTGVTKYNQGLDSNSLNKTMGGISQIMNASQQRIKLIARIFAETGVKECFLLVHQKLKKHSDKALTVRINNKFVNVDPRQWKTRTDMKVSVGIGTGNKDQQLGHLMTILQVQKEGLQIGITTPEHIYKSAKRLAENAGFKDGDEFFTEPQQQQPKPDPEMVKAQAEMQIHQAKFQGEQQMQAAKLQGDQQAAQIKQQNDMQMAQQKLQNDMQLAREKMNAEIELAREKAMLEAQLNKEIAEMRGQADMVSAMNQPQEANESAK